MLECEACSVWTWLLFIEPLTLIIYGFEILRWCVCKTEAAGLRWRQLFAELPALKFLKEP